jgi:hypothetical protein
MSRRLLARIVGAVLIVVAAWLLLVPITAVYTTNDRHPDRTRLVGTLHSWWTSEQQVVYVDATGVDPPLYDPNNPERMPRLNGIRLNCGNTFTTGAHEQAQEPDGQRMCSEAESTRRVVGLTALILGVAAVLGAGKLPSGTDRHNRYRQPMSQRLALWRSR